MHLGAPATSISLVGLRPRSAQLRFSWFQRPTQSPSQQSMHTWTPVLCLRKSCGDSRTRRLPRWRPTGAPEGPAGVFGRSRGNSFRRPVLVVGAAGMQFPGSAGFRPVPHQAGRSRRCFGWPVDSNTDIHRSPSGSTWFRSRIANAMGTCTKRPCQRPTTISVRPLIAACTAL